MSAETDDLIDALNDTDALRCCSCPSCNFYAPDYEEHKSEPCATWALINQYADAKAAEVRRDTAERIARAIEAVPLYSVTERPAMGGYDRHPYSPGRIRDAAARIARDEATR